MELYQVRRWRELYWMKCSSSKKISYLNFIRNRIPYFFHFQVYSITPEYILHIVMDFLTKGKVQANFEYKSIIVRIKALPSFWSLYLCISIRSIVSLSMSLLAKMWICVSFIFKGCACLHVVQFDTTSRIISLGILKKNLLQMSSNRFAPKCWTLWSFVASSFINST